MRQVATFAVLATLVSGCVVRPNVIGPFIRSVEIADGILVIEKCTILNSNNRISVDACTIERRNLASEGPPGQVMSPPSAPAPPAAPAPEPEPEMPGPAGPQVCFQAVRIDGVAAAPFCFPTAKICRQQLGVVRARRDIYASAGACTAQD